MIKIGETEKKVTPSKKNIKLTGILVKELRLVDESGDITQQVIDALPPDTEYLNFKITVELPQEVGSDEE